jgi:bacterioferritin-associated ferredoxin
MCKSSSATEDTSNGAYKVDSVVVRIAMQQNNCICRVTLDNQIQNSVAVGLRKYDGLTSSAPEKDDCGLAVDINHISDMSTGNVIAPIECLVNETLRYTPLFQNGYLQFRSRIINGDFIRGFCIRIKRGKSSLQIVNLKTNLKPIMFVLQQTNY